MINLTNLILNIHLANIFLKIIYHSMILSLISDLIIILINVYVKFSLRNKELKYSFYKCNNNY